MENIELEYKYFVLVPLTELSSNNEKISLSTEDIAKYARKVCELTQEIYKCELVTDMSEDTINSFINKYSSVIDVIMRKNKPIKFRLNANANLASVAETISHQIGRDMYEVMSSDEALDVLLPEVKKIYKIEDL